MTALGPRVGLGCPDAPFKLDSRGAPSPRLPSTPAITAVPRPLRLLRPIPRRHRGTTTGCGRAYARAIPSCVPGSKRWGGAQICRNGSRRGLRCAALAERKRRRARGSPRAPQRPLALPRQFLVTRSIIELALSPAQCPDWSAALSSSPQMGQEEILCRRTASPVRHPLVAPRPASIGAR